MAVEKSIVNDKVADTCRYVCSNTKKIKTLEQTVVHLCLFCGTLFDDCIMCYWQWRVMTDTVVTRKTLSYKPIILRHRQIDTQCAVV